MGLWTDRVLPRLVDRALRTPEVNARRASTLAVTAAGLERVELTRECGDGPKPFSYLHRGRAAA